ncbi:aspartyl/asparaginyl beta-hydroxylase domain-containing protein [Haliangium ochraceum]|uniref:Aspartyl/Asparaginyl beta-hydroxylase n=1 Tax=Haliangium ochraceum (strain DSM 14365 / JCM 11303 / SMP-2) TaxID=502025 RepID=D0LJB3_HALO1|nr:aspartyl/asparaginyl beta-hydroxylase domain-containing protein [Haliangium ochraceum]ACY14960.1 Aspartyl/Asparaginyl beta-hydroxylase [Haliangium ochraceum DSM 14365]
MFQRPTPRSPDAIAKRYRFLQLPGAHDIAALREELAAATIPWTGSQWKWHMETRFCILRAGSDDPYPGGAMVSGAGIDQPVLQRLPLLRAFLDSAFPVPARLAWLGLSPPGARIFLHRDNTHHWDEHHRVHVPIETTPDARLCVAGRFVHMPAGTVWAFNNSRPHGAINRGPARIHLMLDLPPGPELDALFAAGQAVEGEPDPAAWDELSQNPLKLLERGLFANYGLIARLLQQ